MFHELPEEYIAVDIAGFQASSIEGVTPNWTSKVQVGKPFRKTPVFKSKIKFIFPNKHFIYLHDTPSRSLYGRQDRAFSSGCIRVEKNIELAELLLNDPEKWNRQSILELIDTNKTQRVNLPKPKPVMLLYVTIWTDENDNFIFIKDVYERDQQVLDGLNEEFTIWQTRAIN